MTRARRLALLLVRLAGWLMPAARREWAEAMHAELHYLDDDRAAVRWALGTVFASAQERMKAMSTRPSLSPRAANRWNIAISAIFAVAYLLVTYVLKHTQHDPNMAYVLCMVWIVPFLILRPACRRCEAPPAE
jgi:hypothetical protein